MTEVFNNYVLQLGSLGIMLAGLVWFGRYLFRYVMEQTKESLKENKALENEFRVYLIKQSAEHHELIEKNTEAFTRLITFLETSFVNYFQERTESQNKLNSDVQEMLKHIKKTKE